MGRVYAGWGLSQAFYREQEWLKLGFCHWKILVGSWEANFRRRDANDLQPQALAVAFDHRRAGRRRRFATPGPNPSSSRLCAMGWKRPT